MQRGGDCAAYRRTCPRCADQRPVLVHLPAGVVQGGVFRLLQRDITATAELVRKGHGFAVLQIKRAIGVHRLRAAARYAGRKYRAAGGLQDIASRRAIVRDIRLLYREAHRFVCHGLGGKNKIAEVNRALVVIANEDF